MGHAGGQVRIVAMAQHNGEASGKCHSADRRSVPPGERHDVAVGDRRAAISGTALPLIRRLSSTSSNVRD